MCKEALHQAGMSVKLTMTCDHCAESLDGKPAQACCPQCLEEQRANVSTKDAPYVSPEDMRTLTGKRRYYIRDQDEQAIAGAMSMLKDSQAMCAKLANALYIAHRGMVERRERITMDPIIFTQRARRYDDEETAVKAALKEWEDGNGV